MSLDALNIFLKNLKYKIPWKSAMWEPSCSRRMARHDETNSRYLLKTNTLSLYINVW